MSPKEFGQWIEFHKKSFPEVKVWMEEHDTDFLMAAWCEALKLVRFDDAMKCTRQMIAGQVDHPNRFEISRLPGAIAKNTPYRCPPPEMK